MNNKNRGVWLAGLPWINEGRGKEFKIRGIIFELAGKEQIGKITANSAISRLGTLLRMVVNERYSSVHVEAKL